MGSLPTPSATWEALQGKRKCLYTCTFPWPSLRFPCGSAGKESAYNVGDLGSSPGLGRSAGEGKGYPLQFSGLENSMDYIVHGGHKESDMNERLSLSLWPFLPLA